MCFETVSLCTRTLSPFRRSDEAQDTQNLAVAVREGGMWTQKRPVAVQEGIAYTQKRPVAVQEGIAYTHYRLVALQHGIAYVNRLYSVTF